MRMRQAKVVLLPAVASRPIASFESSGAPEKTIIEVEKIIRSLSKITNEVEKELSSQLRQAFKT